MKLIEQDEQAAFLAAKEFFLQGLLEMQHGHYEAAKSAFSKSLEFVPGRVSTLINLSAVLTELEDYAQALRFAQEASSVEPNAAEPYLNMGNVYRRQRDFSAALTCYDKAIFMDGTYDIAYNNRAAVLNELGRKDESLLGYQKAVAINPAYADAYNNLGYLYADLKRFPEAVSAFAKAYELAPDTKWLAGSLLHTRMKVCDWERYDCVVGQLLEVVELSKPVTHPFTLLALPASSAQQKQAAKYYAHAEFRVPPAQNVLKSYAHQKLKIAYLSADYFNHATVHLMAELFDLHDRSRFEVIGICYGKSPDDHMRQRVAKSFDRFIEAADKSDFEIAALVEELEIDIAIDLKGHTQDNRLGILAHRPAPVQVHYLGYPGTIGADFIDYLIADSTLIPFDQRSEYVEKIVYLPDTYQVNDRARKISGGHEPRTIHGLPEQGFVFCCFNNSWKITPEIFDTWMRLLKQVEGSVLWLLEDNATATANLVKEAKTRNVNPDRLIFAGRLPIDQHLARHRHADLFLDTLYYNAHTTASDALWAGLPVLTKLGETYAGRVAASLLNAIGLPELITYSLADYEALAYELAKNPVKLNAIKRKLIGNRLTTPLFDTPRFTRHLENAYEQMAQRSRQGLAPEHIYVVGQV